MRKLQGRMYQWAQDKGWGYSPESVNKNVRYLARAALPLSRLASVLDQVRSLPESKLFGNIPGYAVEKGFIDFQILGKLGSGPLSSGDDWKDFVLMKLVLVFTEVGEAVESVEADDMKFRVEQDKAGLDKPEGLPIEIADIIIRCMTLLSELGYDAEEMVRAKQAYNELRSFRHGGKKA